jgi:hypothetical protein
MRGRDEPRDEAGGELATAVGLLIAAMLVLAGFLLYQSIADRHALLATIASQEQPLQQAKRVQAQLNALASATAKLADEGDAGAKQIIDNMKKQGIHVQP